MDPHTNGMYTRNLIGSLCSNAFKLKDPEERMGEWFILQDLSVRTEGTFRSVLCGRPLLFIQLTHFGRYCLTDVLRMVQSKIQFRQHNR